MIQKGSPVWQMSSTELIEHLQTISAPDQIYWDSRELKKTNRKFQNMNWDHWPHPVKIDNQWQFKNANAQTPPSAPAQNTPKPIPAYAPDPISTSDTNPIPTNVEARIRHPDFIHQCNYISLHKDEYNLYHGCGWQIGRFINGRLVALHNPNGGPDDNSIEDKIHTALPGIHDFMQPPGDYWIGMCSCYQFTEPQRLTNNPNNNNIIHRLLTEKFDDELCPF